MLFDYRFQLLVVGYWLAFCCDLMLFDYRFQSRGGAPAGHFVVI